MTTETAIDTAALYVWLAKELDLPCSCGYGGENDHHPGDYHVPAGYEGMGLVLEAMRVKRWHIFIEIEGQQPDVTISDPQRGTYNADGHEYLVLAHQRHDSLPTAVALAAKAALEAE